MSAYASEGILFEKRLSRYTMEAIYIVIKKILFRCKMDIYTDVLVIGSGLAGLSTALTLAKKGNDVLLLSNGSDYKDCNSYHAQGGIIYKGNSDSPELFEEDVFRAGVHANNPEAVKHLTNMGPKAVKEILIDEVKIPFDLTSTNELDFTEEGAHSLQRIIHSKDHTGATIQECMSAYIKKYDNIQYLYDHTVVKLLSTHQTSLNIQDVFRQPTCVGAFALDQNSGEVKKILAKETVLATGGVGQLFQYTTNSRFARGDGIAIASELGARMNNLEYIQFHPTTLYYASKDRFLISESLRGEGAILYNNEKRRFMKRYHPQQELAPRDVVARAIHREMMLTNADYVYLDISFKDSKWIIERFPHIYSRCLEFNIDITKDPIPVVPAAHYSCGGIGTDLEGRTNIERLWAVGEVACTGIHGANRLASTSLLECLLWGQEAGNAISEKLSTQNHYYFPPIADWISHNNPMDLALIKQDWLNIRLTMWNYLGLVRTPKKMQRAKRILTELQMEIGEIYFHTTLSDELIGLRNAINASLLILKSAMQNKQSIGCHYLEK